MSDSANSDLRSHATDLTDEIKRLASTESLDAKTIGITLRAIRTGCESSALKIAADPNIGDNETGLILKVLAMLHEAVDASFDQPAARPTVALPKLRRHG